MEYYGVRIDENSIVDNVIVLSQQNIVDEFGVISEEVAKSFIANSLKLSGNWFLGSIDGSVGKNRPCKLGKYLPEYKAFIFPKPIDDPKATASDKYELDYSDFKWKNKKDIIKDKP